MRDLFSIEGKVAVVTGAGSGIGLAMCHAFAAEGCAVVLADVQRDALEQAAADVAGHGAETLAVETDVSDREQVEALARSTIDRFGGVHIVCNNAGYGWIKAGQKSGFEARYFSVDFTRTDHAAVAAAYGIKSWRVEDPADLEPVLREAIAHDGPTLVDVIAEPLQDAAAPVSEWVA